MRAHRGVTNAVRASMKWLWAARPGALFPVEAGATMPGPREPVSKDLGHRGSASMIGQRVLRPGKAMDSRFRGNDNIHIGGWSPCRALFTVVPARALFPIIPASETRTFVIPAEAGIHVL